ncbi:hypothetical protein KUCAC02_022884, partial [Chaenocephalus aceratus]
VEGKKAIARHTQRNRKLLVRDRLRLLLDDEDFLELSLLAGLGLPYGDIPAAGCLTGIGRINGLWCVFIAMDATVKGGTAYPITNQGGRTFYNEAIMSAMKIPQVSVVCGSCTAGGAYIPTMAEETVMVHRIGTIFLGGPPLVKAATGEEVTPEDLGGATLHAEVSGCVDHFSWDEKEAYECTRNIVSTLNFLLPEEEEEDEERTRKKKAEEEPLYSSEELLGLAPKSYNYSLDVKMVVSRLTDGSRFQEFKTRYGTTLITGFAKIHGDIPLLFLQNTVPTAAPTLTTTQAEMNTNRLKAQDSYAMCGRAFDPNFLFLWPNARVSMTAPGHAASLPCPDSEAEEEEEEGEEEEEKKQKQEDRLNKRLDEESSAFFSSGRLWDDGVILPQDTRKVLRDCLDIIKQQQYQLTTERVRSALLRV